MYHRELGGVPLKHLPHVRNYGTARLGIVHRKKNSSEGEHVFLLSYVAQEISLLGP
jgi:hypothetical protein